MYAYESEPEDKVPLKALRCRVAGTKKLNDMLRVTETECSGPTGNEVAAIDLTYSGRASEPLIAWSYRSLTFRALLLNSTECSVKVRAPSTSFLNWRELCWATPQIPRHFFKIPKFAQPLHGSWGLYLL